MTTTDAIAEFSMPSRKFASSAVNSRPNVVDEVAAGQQRRRPVADDVVGPGGDHEQPVQRERRQRDAGQQGEVDQRVDSIGFRRIFLRYDLPG